MRRRGRWLYGCLLLPGLSLLCGISTCNSGDADNDGYTTAQGDCDDSNANIYPGAIEVCNGIDDNCDGIIPANEVAVNGVLPCAVVAENVVGSDGGTVEVTDPTSPVFGMELEIPAGALTETTNIQVVVTDSPPTIPAPFTQVGTAVQLEPAGLMFTQPIFLHVPWTTNSANEPLVVGHYSDDTGAWTALPLWGEDDQSRTVALTSSFSIFTGLIFPMTAVSTPFSVANDGFPTINRAVTGATDGSCWGYSLFANWYWQSGKSAQHILGLAYSIPTNTAITIDAQAVQGTVENAFARVFELMNPLFPTDIGTLSTVVGSMLMTDQPQVIMLKQMLNSSIPGHAVLAVGWTGTDVLIYDPNLPGATQKIHWNGDNFDTYDGYDTFIALNIEPIVSYNNLANVYAAHAYDGPVNANSCSQSVDYLYVYKNTTVNGWDSYEAQNDCESGAHELTWSCIETCVGEYAVTKLEPFDLNACLQPCPAPLDPTDVDNDGDGYTENEGDCRDDNSTIHPGATEICADGIDQDCSGADLKCVDYVVGIAGGFYHSLALNADGTVWAWGINGYGQLGDGTLTNRVTPVRTQNLSDVIVIAAGEYYSLALKADGTVWAWGWNLYGQLGDGTTTDSSIPIQVQNLSGVMAIAAGYGHSLALKVDGTVWAWGSNGGGQLGDGTTTDSSIPVQVQSLSGVTAISAGWFHSLALKADGTVWAWGENGNGQLGDGTTTNRTTPVQVQSLVSSIIAIGAGGWNSLALSADGIVWAWGGDWYGQLGDGTTTNRTIPTPMQVQNLSGIIAIAGGCDHSLALKADTTVRAWGCDLYGQLGNGTTSECSIAVPAYNLSNVTVIAAGVWHSLALKTDGTVWAWGYNGGGELGNGTTIDSAIPVQVQGMP